MTVKILGAWNGRSPGQIVTLDGATETRLINAGLATADLNYQATEDGELLRARKTLTGEIEVSAGETDLATVFADQITDGYFCHLWAGSSSNGDPAIPDISGAGRNGAFHTGLTKTMAWAAPGFASTDTGGTYRTFLLPALTYDYAAGESLIIVWKGRGTPPASFKGLVADSNGSSEAGIAVRVDAAGKIQSYLSDGTGRFLTLTTSAAVEPTVTHTYALAIDGLTRKFEQHVDGVVEGGGGAGGFPIGDGVTGYDCRSAKQIKIGTANDYSTIADTVALQTQALVILRGRIGRGLPSNYRELMQSIARQPDRLVTRGWW